MTEEPKSTEQGDQKPKAVFDTQAAHEIVQKAGLDVKNKDQMKIPENVLKVNKAWADTHANHPLAKKIKAFAIEDNAQSAVDKIKELQKKLGFTGDDIDGIMGPRTSQKYMDLQEKGDKDNDVKEANKILADFDSVQKRDETDRLSVNNPKLTAEGEKLVKEAQEKQAQEKAKQAQELKTKTEAEKAQKEKVDNDPKVKKAKEDLTKAELANKDANKKTGEVADKIDTATSKNKEIDTKVNELTGKNKDIKTKLETATRELASTTDTVNTKTGASDKIDGELKLKQGDINHAKDQLSEAEKIDDMDPEKQDKIDAITTKISKLEGEFTQKNTEKLSIDREIAPLKEKATKLTADIQALKPQAETAAKVLKDYTDKNKKVNINALNSEAGTAVVEERRTQKALETAQKTLDAARKNAEKSSKEIPESGVEDRKQDGVAENEAQAAADKSREK